MTDESWKKRQVAVRDSHVENEGERPVVDMNNHCEDTEIVETS